MALSASARAAVQSDASAVLPIVLITISHADLDEPIRISTDPTQRLSVDPLRYGTIHQGLTFYYALITVPMPGQGDTSSDTVTMTIDIVTPDMAAIATVSTFPATVDLIQVMSDTPDVVEAQRLGLEAKSATVDPDAGTISIEIGEVPRLEEPTQRHRMTADRFPALHRR